MKLTPHLGRVIELIELASRDGLMDSAHPLIKFRADQPLVPLHLGLVARIELGLGERCVMHAKPDERTTRLMHLKRRIKSSARLITDVSHAPIALL